MTDFDRHVLERRFALCITCDASTNSRYLRDDPDATDKEIRWCEEGEHEFTDARYVTARPRDATRFD